ncbi:MULTISPECIES: nucleoside triphosphate pyrophosphohydrolase [Deinococcus]|uniref:Nucleoside triphosphate pyrophosphohydrolase n=1 Tax=Deinococcus rufus TaxID=2136097 RepID=A0ABV7ZFL6_9DEIO|nr:nucleoside triphosphate pyrophosphohydrolase [Deinococcus sp. AB2017081]WQE93691.1 nucleoside triphosphate pyrophosphohydrolase [Deinococcus sp. AB2017081]
MGKLVRDRIPDLFGGTAHVLDDDGYRAALRDKLQEEVTEYLASGEVLELADVLEVVNALAPLDGISATELDGMRGQKAQDRGAFRDRLWWTPT